MYEDKMKLEHFPKVIKVRCSFFSTCVGFLEITISYEGLDIDSIIDFAYKFKRAMPSKQPQGKESLYSFAHRILPTCELFFTKTKNTSTAYLKYECHCLHMIQLDEKPDDEHKFYTRLCLLRINYGTKFVNQITFSDDNYDMVYKPYQNDCWAGTQEGLVNICYLQKKMKIIFKKIINMSI